MAQDGTETLEGQILSLVGNDGSIQIASVGLFYEMMASTDPANVRAVGS